MPAPEDVTVIICTRERPHMLADALASFRAATPDAARILVVDSASTTAETREVALAAGADYVRSDIKGLSIARNLGLASSTSGIVVYTDDDCVGVDGWLTDALARFDDPRVGAVTGRMLDHTLLAGAVDVPSRVHTRTIEGLDAGHGAVMAFRRDLLVTLGGFDPTLGAGRRLAGAEDLDIFCRILAAGRTIVFEPRCVVHHMNTREDEAYAELHRGYGLGLGALGAKWLRMRPRVGAPMIAIAVKRTVSRMFRNRRNPRRRHADFAMLRGLTRGIGAGIVTPIRSGVFADRNPPAPIVLAGERGDEGS